MPQKINNIEPIRDNQKFKKVSYKPKAQSGKTNTELGTATNTLLKASLQHGYLHYNR